MRTDFSTEAARAGVFALSFAQDCSAHIYFCHVLPAPDGTPQMDGQELNEEVKTRRPPATGSRSSP